MVGKPRARGLNPNVFRAARRLVDMAIIPIRVSTSVAKPGSRRRQIVFDAANCVQPDCGTPAHPHNYLEHNDPCTNCL
jgi:hypothetical protein